MQITTAERPDVDPAARCLVAAFAEGPIAVHLLCAGPGYPEGLTRFFSLLMRARIALGMPVFLGRGADGVHAAAMGNSKLPPAAPKGKPSFFGAVQTKKSYVSDHLMPVYEDPGLLSGISDALRKRMQGKSCFNFSEVDAALFRELDALTKKCAAKGR